MNSKAAQHQGFTLVELLVVIRIIALLISIILPSVGLARQAAARTACAAKLHSIMQAAQLHLNDHKGYFPLAGFLPGNQPSDLNDTYRSNYTYMSYAFGGLPQLLAPITVALSAEMSYGAGILASSNTSAGTAETDDLGYTRNFLCPAQASSTSEIYATRQEMLCAGVDGRYIFCYRAAQSYVFNEAVLGWSDSTPADDKKWNRLQGRISQVRQSSKTMFACDGLGGSLTKSHAPGGIYSADDLLFDLPWATIYNVAPYGPITLADAFAGDGLAGDPQNFDKIRHHNRMNVAFCDGHVEQKYISMPSQPNKPTQDLATVFILAP